MGVIFGIINIIVAVWFFSTAVSVKKQAIMWAAFGGFSFLVFKFLGYSTLAVFLDILDQVGLNDLTDQGYIETERSADALTSESFDEQSTAAGIFYELFPLIVALLGIAFIRAKFLLGMGFFESLKHKTSLKFVEQESKSGISSEVLKLFGAISNWWGGRKAS